MTRESSRSQETRRRILDAAGWCFAREGFAGTTTRNVARLAKVNVATLNYHFGGKEALHHAALDAAHEEMAGFRAPTELPEEPEARVRAVVAAFYRFARRHRGALRLLLRTTLHEGALPEPLRARQAADGLARARELLSAMSLPPEAMPSPLALLSLNHLVVRYAISADRAVTPFTTEPDIEEEVGRHLGDVAVAITLGGG